MKLPAEFSVKWTNDHRSSLIVCKPFEKPEYFIRYNSNMLYYVVNTDNKRASDHELNSNRELDDFAAMLNNYELPFTHTGSELLIPPLSMELLASEFKLFC